MDIPSLIQHYGYLAVAIGTFLEGETVLVTAGIAAHHGYLSLPAVIVVATFASFVGDQLFFYIGRLYGVSLLARFPSLQARTASTTALLHRHHVPIILAIRFLYGLRVAGPIAIGMSGVPRLRFLILNLIGAIIWAILIALVGYGIGQGMHLARDLLGIGEGWLLAILAVSGIIVGLIVRARRQRH